jgi:hypothetical protein
MNWTVKCLGKIDMTLQAFHAHDRGQQKTSQGIGVTSERIESYETLCHDYSNSMLTFFADAT